MCHFEPFGHIFKQLIKINNGRSSNSYLDKNVLEMKDSCLTEAVIDWIQKITSDCDHIDNIYQSSSAQHERTQLVNKLM